jgi:hypothetical protein
LSDVGEDSDAPGSNACRSPPWFTGTIKNILTGSQPATLTPADQQRIQEAERAAAIAK